ncbi:MAG: SCP2 sterol-binding domain-containing protein [Proteobacteria bacterium]|nr:SCP2 sterol-binding domain-containing protein [Pseudomonadota bacterium]MBU4382657.1 SCP2 sterol-binding domain-containing protein [Pseudomonadota bacterium]MCG2765171.1 SCP2 sterol-binding domain-containing protein [Desulfarculaceae bacterium]
MPYSKPIEALEDMLAVFNPQAAEDLTAVFQWDVLGENGGVWHIKVANGKAELINERHPSPTVSQTCGTDLFLAMVNYEINGMQAFMSGKLKMTGDMNVAQKIYEVFPLAQPEG